MIYVSTFSVEYDQYKGEYILFTKESPVCPKCGGILSGYDSRRRHVVDNIGEKIWYRVRRLRCKDCGAIHTVLPAFMIEHKHYSKQTIVNALNADKGFCPADDSTIRRWKKIFNPPSLPSIGLCGDVQLKYTITKEGEK